MLRYDHYLLQKSCFAFHSVRSDIIHVRSYFCPEPSEASSFVLTPHMTWEPYKNLDFLGSGNGRELFYLFLLGIMYQSILVIIEFRLVGRVVAAVFKTNLRAFSNNVLDDDARIEEELVHRMVQTGG
jgi:hypothetical protein